MCFLFFGVEGDSELETGLVVLLPAVVFRPELTQNLEFCVLCKAFIKPNVIPPLDSDEIAKPHVRHFMSHISCISLESFCCRVILVMKKDLSSKRDAPPILHSAD